VIQENVLYETKTPHERYIVVERTYEGRPARVLFSGQRRAAQSGIGLDDDPDLLFDYNQRLLELASGLYPKQVLVIGGGAFTLPMALISALPKVVVDVVELDAGLEPISKKYFGLQANERLHISFGDGREFLAASSAMYDLIILDVFSELSIPAQFLTQEFVQLALERLGPDGHVAMNIIASLQGRNTALIKSQIAGYSLLFADVTIFPAAHGLSGWLPQNLILVAQKNTDRTLEQYMRFAPLELLTVDDSDIQHDKDDAPDVALA
jgi:hypothetical protein